VGATSNTNGSSADGSFPAAPSPRLRERERECVCVCVCVCGILCPGWLASSSALRKLKCRGSAVSAHGFCAGVSWLKSAAGGSLSTSLLLGLNWEGGSHGIMSCFQARMGGSGAFSAFVCAWDPRGGRWVLACCVVSMHLPFVIFSVPRLPTYRPTPARPFHHLGVHSTLYSSPFLLIGLFAAADLAQIRAVARQLVRARQVA